MKSSRPGASVPPADISTAPGFFTAYPSANMRHTMATSKLALPDIDPSIAMAQVARPKPEWAVSASHPPVDQLIERARRARSEFTVALLRRFVVRLESLFLPAHIKSLEANGGGDRRAASLTNAVPVG